MGKRKRKYSGQYDKYQNRKAAKAPAPPKDSTTEDERERRVEIYRRQFEQMGEMAFIPRPSEREDR